MIKILNERYIIITLDDAKEIVKYIPEGRIKNRFNKEEGADISDIIIQLKKLPICHPCEIESWEHNCYSLIANKLGRRLNRLLDRAK